MIRMSHVTVTVNRKRFKLYGPYGEWRGFLFWRKWYYFFWLLYGEKKYKFSDVQEVRRAKQKAIDWLRKREGIA